jgi:threonine aldolase
VQPWQTVLCHHQAHILVDEATAVELFSGGARLVPISRFAGKLTAAHLDRHFRLTPAEVPHNARAAALSITQANEAGLVYTPEEIAALGRAARERGLRVHMDGARFANAVAALGCTPAELSWQAGVDVLCLGATKCGALAAEAVIFFRPELAEAFVWRRKRAGHLLSKGRFFGAQFVGWLQDDHWLKLARHANEQAARLAAEMAAAAEVRVVWPTEANEVFALMPSRFAQRLKAAGAEFYQWFLQALPTGITAGDDDVFVRLVTSYATRDDEIARFGRLLQG